MDHSHVDPVSASPDTSPRYQRLSDDDSRNDSTRALCAEEGADYHFDSRQGSCNTSTVEGSPTDSPQVGCSSSLVPTADAPDTVLLSLGSDGIPHPRHHRKSSGRDDAQVVATVGLINEGTTCYLNSLLQLLFHLNYFRAAVYRIPAEDDTVSVYKALQELFFQMQERETAVHTRRLTEAFGWGESELFVQHDIQEMATLLRDNLEEKMKGTVTEGTINQLFEGRGEQFVETLDKSYSSRRSDVFYDIHLPLSGYTTLLDSLTSLTAKDKLVGDNKYRVEREGQEAVYADAEKGYAFRRFPLVTWFHLKRFSMDFNSPTLEMKKVNTRLEFPEVLDLTELEQGFSPEDEGAEEAAGPRASGESIAACACGSPAVYDLHGVIVHRGTARSGHYYCYIRDWDSEQQRFTRWIEFEDENVRVVDADTAIRVNYGGGASVEDVLTENLPLGGRHGGVGGGSSTSAYLLCYVRRAAIPTVLGPCRVDIIKERLMKAMLRELEAESRQLKAELLARERITMYIVTDRSLSNYCREQQMELMARDGRSVSRFAECTLEMSKHDSLRAVYDALDAQPSLACYKASSRGRLWRWSYDPAFRPTQALPTYTECGDDTVLVEKFLTRSEAEKPLSMCLFLELPSQLTLQPGVPCTDLPPLIKRFKVDSTSGIGHATLRVPTSVRGLCIVLADPGYRRECKVDFTVTTAATGEQRPTVMKAVIRNGAVLLPLDSTCLTHSICFHCSTSSSGSETLQIASVHFQLHSLPTSLAAPRPQISAAPSWNATAQLPETGHDRVLVMMHFFNHISSSVNYLGAMQIDASDSLRSCEPRILLMLGVPYEVAVATNTSQHHHHSSNSNSSGGGSEGATESGADGGAGILRFFEENKGIITRELPSTLDLWESRIVSGSIIVAQFQSIPIIYRNVDVRSYYQSLASAVEVHAVAVEARTVSNEAEMRQCLENYKKGAGTQSAAEASQKDDSSSVVTNPYRTTLPCIYQQQLHVREDDSAVCRMAAQWCYETICDCIASHVSADAHAMRLYRGTTVPDPQPLRSQQDSFLEDLLLPSGYPQSTTLFYERLPVPRGVAEAELSFTVTLRDVKGHALHCQRYTLPRGETKASGLLRIVLHSILPWEYDVDPWGTLRETVQAPNFLLTFVSVASHSIHYMYEVEAAVAVAGGQGEEARAGSSARAVRLGIGLMGYDVELQALPPLSAGEQRVACCHGDSLAGGILTPFGHPFTITVSQATTVQEAQRRMLEATGMCAESLHSENRRGVMMMTDVLLHFPDWSEFIANFWAHTPNHSGHIPSLVLNHAAPKEKPGSRYVVQSNPKLKISSN